MSPNPPLQRRLHIDALADEIATLVASIDAATHQLLTCIRAFDLDTGWALQGAKSCAHWLSWRTGRGLVAAREWVRVAHALADLPLIDQALSEGAISYTKVRAMTRVATPDNEQLLLDQAQSATGAQLERVCAAFAQAKKRLDPEQAPQLTDEDHRYVRRRTMRDGTVLIEARLLPDEAEAVMEAIRLTRARRDSGELDQENDSAESSADALVAIAHQQLAHLEQPTDDEATHAPSAKRRELLVHLRTSDIVEGTLAAELHDGTPVDGATFQRLACDAGLVLAHTTESGDPLDVGRRRRTIPPSLMRALLLRDRGCRFPGCNHQAHVEAHHLEHWSQGGATTKDNLVLLCHHHHVALHEGGFTGERQPDGTLLFRDAEGRPLTRPKRIAQPLPETDDPKVNLIRWDGAPQGLRGAIRALVARA